MKGFTALMAIVLVAPVTPIWADSSPVTVDKSAPVLADWLPAANTPLAWCPVDKDAQASVFQTSVELAGQAHWCLSTEVQGSSGHDRHFADQGDTDVALEWNTFKQLSADLT